jgi:hypothetical protein
MESSVDSEASYISRPGAPCSGYECEPKRADIRRRIPTKSSDLIFDPIFRI